MPPDVQSANVLTYAPPSKRGYRRVDRTALVASVLLLGVYYVGLVPDTSYVSFNFLPEFAWEEPVPPTEVFSVVLRVPPHRLLQERHLHRYLWFFPFAVAALTAFLLVRQVRLKMLAAAVAMLAPLAPLLVLEPTRCAWAPLLSLVIAPAFLGYCDGETWTDGVVAWGAVGGWMILWFVMLVVLMVTRRTYAAA